MKSEFVEYNPENLTLTDAERSEGWRFLSEEEYEDAPLDSEFYMAGEGRWTSHSSGGPKACAALHPHWTFRTQALIPVSPSVTVTPVEGAGAASGDDQKVIPFPTPAPADIVAATIQERGKVYGEPHLSHENIGLAWTAKIQQHYGIRLDHPLPHWLVALMMTDFKTQRSARVFHADNYVDAKAYLKFAEHGQEFPKDPFCEPEEARRLRAQQTTTETPSK